MNSSILDDVFQLLALAAELENSSSIEAATKYYEAVYLMKRYLERGLPSSESQNAVKLLLKEKIRHYEQIAASLMEENPNTQASNTIFDSPRSPLSLNDANNQISLRRSSQSMSGISSNTTDSTFINDAASKANTKLAHALDMDESGKIDAAIAAYMEASETYLAALQAAEKLISQGQTRIESVASFLRRRLTQTLDRVEQLKLNNNIQSSGKQRIVSVPRKELSSVGPRDSDNFSTVSQQSHLTPAEIAILKNSSLISSGLFLPWSDKDAVQLLKETQAVIKDPSVGPSKTFTDPDGFLALSPKQKDRFYKWARPSEIVQIRQKSRLTRALQIPVIVKAITPYTIKQQYVTDCSFIASLCICASFERRFRKSLITSILHPQDVNGNMIYSPIGKYMVKLWLNGVARSVVIDDYLPIDKHGNLLCSQTSSITQSRNPEITELNLELWVCLIEKAYMKLCGGYDFPGSNSGVDLFALTGWIPERIMFAKDPMNIKDFETHPDRAFDRIYSSNSFGDCLITVSTELQLTDAEADKIGLVTGHAYAVLDVVQTKNGTKLLQLKNPWAHKGWKGRFSCRDSENWKDPSFRAEVGYDPDIAILQDDGVFWACWDDILKYFQNFHLSWNPFLFKFRLVTHGFWPAAQGPKDDTFNIGENPQYVVSFSQQAIKQKATIWILISRHVTKQEQNGAEATDYLTLHVHRNSQRLERIWYPGKSGNCILVGVYTNNPHVLVRYDVEGPEDQFLSIVLSQYNKSSDLGYTLSCFCTEDFSLGTPKGDLPYVKDFSSEWSPTLSGGPVGRASFANNPMFAVKVPEEGATMQLTVSTSTTAAVNTLLVPVKTYGDGIDRAIGESVLDSGNYRHGFIATDKRKVKGGVYVLIVSNYHKGECAQFQLNVFSSCKLKISVIS